LGLCSLDLYLEKYHCYQKEKKDSGSLVFRQSILIVIKPVFPCKKKKKNRKREKIKKKIKKKNKPSL
jgi:hypothetical protein